MGNESSTAQTAGDYNEHPDAMDKRFARFGLRPLSDADVWALSMAAMVMPDGNPGAEGYLSQVSGTTLFSGRLTMWGRVVAIGIAHSLYKAPNGRRRRTYVEGYDSFWAEFAVADGLTIALYGTAADELGYGAANYQGYRRIRDFVGGALVNAIAEFRVALEWATGSRRDRVLDGRWEGITGLNYRDTISDAKMSCGQGYFPLFSPGCKRTNVAPSDTRQDPRYDQIPEVDPETIYRGLRPTDWWDDEVASKARKWPVTTIYPATE